MDVTAGDIAVSTRALALNIAPSPTVSAGPSRTRSPTKKRKFPSMLDNDIETSPQSAQESTSPQPSSSQVTLSPKEETASKSKKRRSS